MRTRKWAGLPALLMIPAAIAIAAPSGTPEGSAGKTTASGGWREQVVADILKGARHEVENGTTYFLENLYLKTTWLDGVNTKKKVYPWGDIDPAIGVCTDVIIRALRNAGFDLQKRIYEDMAKDVKKKLIYPWGSWKKKHLDTNIDHRRCPNQRAFFRRHSDVYSPSGEVDVTRFQPGDIVYWDLMTGRYHVGIISDRKNDQGVPLVIHNYPSPGYAAEEDVLLQFVVMHRFRFPPESDTPPAKDARP